MPYSATILWKATEQYRTVCFVIQCGPYVLVRGSNHAMWAEAILRRAAGGERTASNAQLKHLDFANDLTKIPYSSPETQNIDRLVINICDKAVSLSLKSIAVRFL